MKLNKNVIFTIKSKSIVINIITSIVIVVELVKFKIPDCILYLTFFDFDF